MIFAPFQQSDEHSLAGRRREVEQAELQREVISTLSQEASSQPVLIVPEDLHWAERTSIELLRVVAPDTAAHRGHLSQ